MFVGRERELHAAAQLLRAAADGRGAVCSLVGGPGIGKTALACRIADEGRRAQMVVLRSSFIDGQDLPPLWPWRTILSKSVRLLEEAAGASDGAARLRNEYGPLLSSLNSEWSTVPGLSELPEPYRKFRYFEWIAGYLRALSRFRPLLISLEDLHNGDDTSLHLIEYLIDFLELEPIFFLLTWRPGEHRGQDRISGLQEQLRHRENAQVLTLHGFSAEETGKLATAASARFSPLELDQFHAWTRGNPLRARMYLQYEGPADRALPSPTSGVETGFVSAMKGRVGAGAFILLQKLSLLGNSFTREEIDALHGHGTGAQRLLDDLLSAGLLVPDVDGRSYGFFHDQFRVDLLFALSVGERRLLVEEVIRRIEQLSTPATERRVRLLKELFLSAQSPDFAEEAERYVLEAVRLSQAKNSWEEVISDLERLLRQYAGQMSPSHRRRLQLQLCLAASHAGKSTFHAQEAVELFNHYRTEGELDDLIELMAGFNFAAEAHEIPDFDRHMESLISRIQPEDRRRPAVLFTYAAVIVFTGTDLDRAQSLCEEAAALGRQDSDLAAELSAVGLLAFLDAVHRRFDAALARAEDFLVRHPGVVSLPKAGPLLAAKLRSLLGLGRIAEFRSFLTNLPEASYINGVTFGSSGPRQMLSRLHLRDGSWHLLPLREPRRLMWEFFHQLPAVTAAYFTGDTGRADAYLEKFIGMTAAYGLERRTLHWIHICWFVGIRAYISGDARWVAECAAKMTELRRYGPPPVSSISLHSVVAARYARIVPCDVESARAHYQSLLENDRYYYEEEEYTTAAAKALLSLRLDDTDRAARHFEEAITFCDTYQERPWRAFYLFELALLLRETDPERAGTLVSESETEANRLGLRPLLGRIAAEWKRRRPEGEPEFAGPAGLQQPAASGLSRRELEVLSCLVEGLTDKEIAVRLNISPFTVGNHLRSVYAKTGSSNRGEAVHRAITRGIVRLERKGNSS